MAADGMSLWLYLNHRAIERGIMTREYASGYLEDIVTIGTSRENKGVVVKAYRSIPRLARRSAYVTL
jgi:hypothetical protein